MKQPKRLLVMAGGTGGHVFPAIAVAKELQQQGWEILWLGTPHRMEAKLVPEHGFNIHFIDIKGLRGNGFLRLISAPFKIISAILQSLKAIRQFKPDVVLGMGGFVSGPGGVAAWLAHKPLILHEQNAVPGLTNRLLSHIAQMVMVAFPHTFKKNEHVVGNPIREDLLKLHKKQKKSQPPLKVLVIGGSLGARIFNETLPDAIKYVQNHNETLHIWHQVGQGNQKQVAQAYASCDTQHHITVDDFIHDMAKAYQWADVVVCRAGALTVSELAVIGLPSILVPLPHAVDDHQTKNAQTLAQAKAGILMPQTQFSAQNLGEQLLQFCRNPKTLNQMSTAASHIAKIDATTQVAQACVRLAQQPCPSI
tara:strand:+ start:9055 stop:10149 length:1095 start_codon:yes stop_codon:yes gene_type:complete